MPSHLFRVRAAFIMSLLALSIFVAGCNNSDNQQSKTVAQYQQTAPIRIGVHSYPSSLFWYLAEDLGYIKDANIDVEITYYSSISDYIDAMSNNQLDVIGLAYMDVFTMWQNGYEVKSVVAADYSYGADTIITRKNSGLDSLNDLKGHTVEVETGTVSEFFLDFVIANRSDLNISDIDKVHSTASEAAAKFKEGKVDAICTFEPYNAIALAAEDGQVIFDSSNEHGLIPDVWVVEKNKLDQDYEAYQKLFKAWFRAVDYYKQNPQEATDMIAKRAGISGEEFRSQLEKLYIMDLRDNNTAFSRASGFESLYGSGRLILDFYKQKNVDDKMPEIDQTLDKSIVQNLISSGT